MTIVDPRLEHIPSRFLEKPDSRIYFEGLERFLHDLWVRTGGGNDAIEAADIAEKFPWPISESYSEAREFTFPALLPEVKEFRAVTVTQNYTANDHDFINANQNAQITFPQYPAENSVIIVRNDDNSSIKLNGNGKNINGSLTGVIARKTTCIEFYYFIDSDEWVAKCVLSLMT